MLIAEEDIVYELECRGVQFGGKLHLEKGEVIVEVETYDDDEDVCGFIILKEAEW